MAEREGQQFGNYRLARLLGKGSFAEVYLGVQVGTPYLVMDYAPVGASRQADCRQARQSAV